MSFKNAARLIDDMQEFLQNIRGHMEPTSSSESEHSSEEYNSTAPSEANLGLKISNLRANSRNDVKLGKVDEEDENEFNELNPIPITDAKENLTPIVSAVLTIVRCTVCLEVPRSYTYQCARGHLICEVCLCFLIRNARKNGETGSCPTCRGIIRKESSWRNNAIEDVAAELPCECKYCLKEFKIKSLTTHEEKFCPLRIVDCKFKNFGCIWSGPKEKQLEHENNCEIGKKPLQLVIENMNEVVKTEKRKCDHIIHFLSGLGVEHVDLDLRPYVTLSDMKKVLYDSPTFKMLGTFWNISAKIESQENESSSYDKLLYRLVWKTPRTGAVNVRFAILKGPFNDAALDLKIQTHRFCDEQPTTEFIEFPFASDLDFARQISNSTISFRLIMSWD